MAEVEDEGPRTQRLEDIPHRLFHALAARGQEGGIEIALHRTMGLQFARLVQARAPVEAHRVDAGFGEISANHGAGVAWKTDDRRLRITALETLDNAFGGIDHPAAEFL